MARLQPKNIQPYTTMAELEAISEAKWDARFMQIADTVAEWSSCFQGNRKIGAVIAKNKRILTTGYKGAGSGIVSCTEREECVKQSRASQEICYAVHAEQNAIIQAARIGVSVEGATIYCTHQPCIVCAKMIINSGIVRVVYRQGEPDDFTLQLFEESGVKIHKIA